MQCIAYKYVSSMYICYVCIYVLDVSKYKMLT